MGSIICAKMLRMGVSAKKSTSDHRRNRDMRVAPRAAIRYRMGTHWATLNLTHHST